MEEFVNVLNEEDLEDVAGGAATARKHVKIVNCKNRVNVRSTASSASDANKIGFAYLGDSYVFYGWTGNWAGIQFGAKKAYVFKDFVKIV